MAQAQWIATTSPRVGVKRKRTLSQRLQANSGFLFIAPAVLIFLVFGLYTVVYSFALSFFRWNGFSPFSLLPPRCEPPGCRFIGLDNFADFLGGKTMDSQLFWQALSHNVVIAILLPLVTILIALPLAIGLNRALRGQAILRTFIMLPMITAGIAVYYVWLGLYQSDGPLNMILNAIGLGFLQAKHGWLGDSTHALPSLIAVMVWSAVPLATILYLAGLQTIDRELYEAAIMDGAGAWSMLWRITWPLLTRVTALIVILSLNTAIQGYEIVYLMTNGGPAGHTDVVGLEIFLFGFGDRLQLGIASAMSWALFFVVFLIGLVNLRIFRPQTEG